MATVADNIESIRETVELAASRAGRSSNEVSIMAVTKTFSRAAVDEAYAAGIRLFGENRVQEAQAKYRKRPEDLRLHLIGHLQRNKARTAVSVFDAVESIDKLSTARALDRHLEDSRTLDVLIEINTSGESSKFGLTEDEELERCIEGLTELAGLRLRGLMTIAPFTDDISSVRASFKRLRRLFDSVSSRRRLERFDTLSMGMSSDFEVAVEEGSTEIRIGSALFGTRNRL